MTMTNDELRALADALEPMAKAPCFDGIDMARAAAYLRQCADAQAEPKREPVGTLTIRDDMGAEITFHRSFTMRPRQTFAIYPNWDLLTHDIPTRGAFVVNAPKEIGNE